MTSDDDLASRCPSCGALGLYPHDPNCPLRSSTPKLTASDGNPKTRFGQAKTPLSLIPGAARVLIAESFRLGSEKYGAANWRKEPVSASTYLNAAERHLLAWVDGEENDPESGVTHLAHAAACLCILMDAGVTGMLLDDRPPPAPTGDLIRRHMKPLG